VALEINLTNHFTVILEWTVKNILKYLKRTKDIFLVYGGCEEELGLKCYTNANSDTNPADSKSQLGYVFMVNGGAVSWRSSKQTTVAQYTMDSKYICSCFGSGE
jgi:hypothetical protein